MNITVEFLTQLRVAAGETSCTVQCEPGTTVQALVERLARERGLGFRALVLNGDDALARSLLVAVGGRQVRGDGVLADGDELVLATPIAGG